MCVKGLFIAVTLLCGVLALLTGRAEALGTEMMAAGGAAVELGLTLCGAYIIWCGLLRVVEEAGLAEKLAHWLSGAMRLLIGREAEDDLVCRSASLNLTANLLGLGNAATPAGLAAVRRMAELAPGKEASPGLCRFVLLNASSLQLVSTTVLSLRAAAGAARPDDVLLPALAGSAMSFLCAVLLGKLFCREEKQ